LTDFILSTSPLSQRDFIIILHEPIFKPPHTHISVFNLANLGIPVISLCVRDLALWVIH